MVTCISHSPAETEALGVTWGNSAASGLVIGLSGELGAGKTQMVKGLARGLGITQRVHSPSFNLVNVYHGGRLTLFHLDLYRLETRQQIVSVGLEEYMDPDGVTVIEWAERLFQVQRPESAIQTRDTVAGGLGSASAVHVPNFTVHSPLLPCFRWVQIETLTMTDRRITYEDPGA